MKHKNELIDMTTKRSTEGKKLEQMFITLHCFIIILN